MDHTKSHDVLIRTAKPADYTICLPLLASLYHGDISPRFEKVFQTLATSKNSLVLLAEVSSKVIGILVGSFELDIDWEAKVGRVQAIITAEGHRRQGIAGRLLSHFITMARKKDCAVIRSRVNKENKNAKSFHKDHGFWIADTYEYILELKEEANHQP